MSLIKSSKASKSGSSFNTQEQKLTLQKTDLKNNNNKFYIIQLFRDAVGDEWCVRTEYGRTGKSSVTEYRYGTEERCKKEVEWLKKDKTKKNYKEVETEDVADEKTPPKKTTKKTKKKEQKLDLPPNIVDFIGYIFKQNTTFIEKSVQTPVGKLSKNQIKNGKSLLKEIDGLISGIPDFITEKGSEESVLNKSGKRNDLEELCNEYYSAIPQSLPQNIRGFGVLIKDENDLARQEDILKALEDLLGVQEAAVSDELVQKYVALGAEFCETEPDDRQEIEKWFKGSQSKRHYVDMKIKDIISIKRDDDFKRWNEKVAKVKTIQAFHGTRNENLLGICSRGLLLPGRHSAAKSGANYGPGIYGAIHSSKSAQYCGSYFRSNGNIYMFVMDMAVGKQYVYDGWVYGGWKGLPKSYNSTWAKSGNGLQHDELIVYNENQARLRHIIKIESKWY